MLYCIEIQQLILNTDSCMTHMTFHLQFTKCQTIMPTNSVTHGGVINLKKHGTLGHAIEHGQVKGSNLTLNVQH